MKIDGRTLDHKTLEHLRTTAVRRVIEDGEAPSAVMESMGLCRTSIYPWLREYQDAGLEALAEKIAQGPEPKLNQRQRQQVKRWIVGRDPRQYGFDYGLWTRRIVQSLIEQKFGLALGLTAVGRLLAGLDITPQKPLRRAYERDPQRIQEWVEQDYPKLRRRAKKYGARIYFLDEAGFRSDPVLGRTYGLKGHTPVVATSGQRQSINAISAVSAKGGVLVQCLYGQTQRRAVCRVLAGLHARPPGAGVFGGGRPSLSQSQEGAILCPVVGRQAGVALSPTVCPRFESR
jgi:transposase